MKTSFLVILYLLILYINVPSILGDNQSIFIEFKDFDKIKAYQILDVRDKRKFISSHLPNSIWLDISKFDARDPSFPSQIGAPAQILNLLRKLGIRNDKSVVIVGESIRSFGEDGRLFWILKEFTNLEVKILNGGFKAIQSLAREHLESGEPLQKEAIKDSPNLLVRLKEDFVMFQYEDLKRTDLSKIDVRTLPEFMGATPFGSVQGGHIPGANWFPWHSFFDEHGRVKKQPSAEFLEKLADKRPLVYCTAGYRSALVYAVLVEWKLDPINYDGSWFEFALRSSNAKVKGPRD